MQKRIENCFISESCVGRVANASKDVEPGLGGGVRLHSSCLIVT